MPLSKKERAIFLVSISTLLLGSLLLALTPFLVSQNIVQRAWVPRAVSVVRESVIGSPSTLVSELRALLNDDVSLPPPGSGYNAGFAVDSDGFGFRNYGSRYPNGDLTITEVWELFGDRVCATGSGESCLPTPATQLWIDTMNDHMADGHCAGFTISSYRLYSEQLPQNAFDPNASITFDITQNVPAMRQIAKDWVLQVAREVWATRVDGTPRDVVDALLSREDMVDLGVFSRSGGGHSLLAYGVEDRGDGIFHILVYDNNWPGEELFIEVDYKANTWRYSLGALNPTEDTVAWEGDARTNSLIFIPFAAYNQAVECPFCEPVAEEEEQKVFVSLTGDSALLQISDDQGNQTGHFGDQYISQIPDSSMVRLKDFMYNDREPIIFLNPRTNFTVQVVPRPGKKVARGNLRLGGPGVAMSIEGLEIEAGKTDRVVISPKRQQLTHYPDQPARPIAKILRELSAISTMAAVGGVEIVQGESLNVTIDPTTGKLAIGGQVDATLSSDGYSQSGSDSDGSGDSNSSSLDESSQSDTTSGDGSSDSGTNQSSTDTTTPSSTAGDNSLDSNADSSGTSDGTASDQGADATVPQDAVGDSVSDSSPEPSTADDNPASGQSAETSDSSSASGGASFGQDTDTDDTAPDAVAAIPPPDNGPASEPARPVQPDQPDATPDGDLRLLNLAVVVVNEDMAKVFGSIDIPYFPNGTVVLDVPGWAAGGPMSVLIDADGNGVFEDQIELNDQSLGDIVSAVTSSDEIIGMLGEMSPYMDETETAAFLAALQAQAEAGNLDGNDLGEIIYHFASDLGLTNQDIANFVAPLNLPTEELADFIIELNLDEGGLDAVISGLNLPLAQRTELVAELEVLAHIEELVASVEFFNAETAADLGKFLAGLDLPRDIMPDLFEELDLPPEELGETLKAMALPPEQLVEVLNEVTLPPDDLAETLTGLDLSPADLGQVLTGMGLPPDEISQVLHGIDLPPSELAPTLAALDLPPEQLADIMTGMDLPADELGQTIAGLNLPPAAMADLLNALELPPQELGEILVSVGLTPSELSQTLNAMDLLPTELGQTLAEMDLPLPQLEQTLADLDLSIADLGDTLSQLAFSTSQLDALVDALDLLPEDVASLAQTLQDFGVSTPSLPTSTGGGATTGGGVTPPIAGTPAGVTPPPAGTPEPAPTSPPDPPPPDSGGSGGGGSGGNPGNSSPNAVDDSITTDVDAPISISVLNNDSDPDNDSLSIASVGAAAHGSAVKTGSTISYTPDPGFVGDDAFSYTVSDGDLSDTATVDVTVNGPPVGVNDGTSTFQEIAVTIGVLGNDSDPNSDSLSLTAVGSAGSGTTSISGNSARYMPNPGFFGSDIFSYTVSDGRLTAGAVVSVTVNGAPVAIDDVATTTEELDVLIDVLDNDSDPESDPLSIFALNPAGNGSIAISGTQVVYTPDQDFIGADVFIYSVTDGNLIRSARVTVTVLNLNDPPDAVNDTRNTNEDTPQSIDVLTNDTDPDNDTLSIVTAGYAGNGQTALSGGNVVYTPTLNFSGVDVFTYTVTDGSFFDTATVTVIVNPVNDDPPVAVADIITTAIDTPVNISVLDNDIDPDNDALSIVTVGAAITGSISFFSGSTIVSYFPASGFSGIDVFTYTVSDGALFDTGVVTVGVGVISITGLSTAGSTQRERRVYLPLLLK